ncbi:hypothetical protein JJB07_14125 [Tumebacillus sp. ITR2]|uniref:Uncharacterized protein n=1 Tax=Tumebacillus amylolyticus TaxID=2801339 RepID=A0ABS1JBX3_9BACL|nr:hypothetical protein [Tumebacillus amylolyticus]MBL0387774.1 hypothetical protein [Tumebacillus amylolyticus]
MFGNRAKSTELSAENSFTCAPLLAVMFLVVVEFFHNFYQDDINRLILWLTHADRVPSYVSIFVSIAILLLIGLLFDRQHDVAIGEEYIQIGNSPLHFYRPDEIREIKLKNGLLTIRTHTFRIWKWYHVKKPQRDVAHRMLCEWANEHGILYRIM